ncbi:unnamed protein product [Microthlaspi erraticum]|nr:unnamed protein product [Microthlaspi erraticum]
MTRKSNKDNLVEHPEIDKLEKILRRQKAQEMAENAARAAHDTEVARANKEGKDPPPPLNPQHPPGDVDVKPQANIQTIGDYDSAMLSSRIGIQSIHHFLQGMTMRSSLKS